MKISWGTAMAIVYAVFAISILIFVVKVSKIKNDLVTEHYYDEAVKFQDRIDENENTISADSKLSITLDEKSKIIHLNVSGTVNILSGKLEFYKPDEASKDFAVNFETNAEGLSAIPVTDIAHGYWKVTAKYVVNGKNCIEQKRIFIP